MIFVFQKSLRKKCKAYMYGLFDYFAGLYIKIDLPSLHFSYILFRIYRPNTMKLCTTGVKQLTCTLKADN